MLQRLARSARRAGIVTLCVLAVPSVVVAQAETRVQNITRTAFGFTASVLFRNTQGFGATNVIGLFQMGIRLGSRFDPTCRTFSNQCGIGGVFADLREGRVDDRTFAIGNTQYRSFVGYWATEDSCVGYCERFYPNSPSFVLGLLGCSVPFVNNVIAGYAGRTCAAEGFDGWLRKDVSVLIDSSLGLPTDFAPSDLQIRFFARTFGPDVYPQSVVPEPSTYALFTTGLAGLVFARRRRNR